MSHSDKIITAAEGFVTTATTSGCEHAAVADYKRRMYGIQFHPEVSHTPCGKDLLRNFVIDICGTYIDVAHSQVPGCH